MDVFDVDDVTAMTSYRKTIAKKKTKLEFHSNH